MNKPYRNKGFTLIELMIVVAIIGILVSLAVLQYNRNVAKAQVAEAVNLLGGVKDLIAVEATINNVFPDDAAIIAHGVKTSGSYVESITSDPDEKTLSALFKNPGSSSMISGLTLVFRRDPDGTWNCKITPSTVPDYLLPKACDE